MNPNIAGPESEKYFMDTITICDLEVRYQVGVTAEERANVQRLLITVEITSDFRRAAGSDDLGDTLDYAALCQRLQRFGDDRHWQLIETVAVDIAEMILADFGGQQVSVEVKKFVIPEARFVAVRTTRRRAANP
jgi:dihydroneopterin aldolase